MKPKTITRFLLLLIVCFTAPQVSVLAQMEKTPAFPGAEGWGRYVTGGRGGQVYHVTNLNDDGIGSLRYALKQSGPRTVVFDISGTIHLKSELKLTAGNVTIAGQTAPGDGICVADWPFVISAPNVIIRYMRFRLGNTYANKVEGDGGHEGDGLGGYDGKNIIVDHCSVSWSIDECLSVYGNDHMTVQWCLVAQSLRNAGHVKGAHGYGGNWGGRGATYHHNLLVHHDSRTPRLGDRPMNNFRDTTDLRNNVMYNWAGNGCYGGEGMHVNIVNNYYKPGPATDARGTLLKQRICALGVRSNASEDMYGYWGKYYVDGNVNAEYNSVTQNNWTRGILPHVSSSNVGWTDVTKDTIKLAEPLRFMAVTTHDAATAYERVLDYAGASLHRDSHDQLMVSDTRNRVATYTGNTSLGNLPGIIDTPYDNGDNPWPTLQSEETPTDSDQDGMPDAWETANGLNPGDPTDGARTNADGYTNLENYLNSLVAHITAAQNEGGQLLGFTESYAPVKDEYVLSKDTKDATGWTFGDGIELSNSKGGSYGSTGSYIRMARDMQHTITLPPGAQVTAVKFEGKGRYSGDSYGDASLVELGGTTFAEGTYALKKGEVGSFTVNLDSPAIGTLTFTFTGNNPDCIITLYAKVIETGIGETTAATATTDHAYYDLSGRRLQGRPSMRGIYIYQGRKIIIK